MIRQQVENTCQQCGKAFQTCHCERHHYCSSACYHAARRGKQTAPYETCICPVCKQSFTKLASQKPIFCSKPCADKAKLIDPAKRLWSRVTQGKPNECWLWQGPTDKDGYGKFWMNGHTIHTSRACYIISFGQVPLGQIVMHTCDNPPCCNPNHLCLGTFLENTQDMWHKGRSKTAKVTPETVQLLRSEYETGSRVCDISRRHDLNYGLVDAAVHRRTWRDI